MFRGIGTRSWKSEVHTKPTVPNRTLLPARHPPADVTWIRSWEISAVICHVTRAFGRRLTIFCSGDRVGITTGITNHYRGVLPRLPRHFASTPLRGEARSSNGRRASQHGDCHGFGPNPEPTPRRRPFRMDLELQPLRKTMLSTTFFPV